MKKLLNKLGMFLMKKLHLFSFVITHFKKTVKTIRQRIINSIRKIIRFFEKLLRYFKFGKMVYLKGTLIDDFQEERPQYCLIGYDKEYGQTITENVVIYPKYYIIDTIRRTNGDFENRWTEAELSTDYFKETTQKQFNLDIKGKKRKEVGSGMTK